MLMDEGPVRPGAYPPGAGFVADLVHGPGRPTTRAVPSWQELFATCAGPNPPGAARPLDRQQVIATVVPPSL